MRKGVGEYPKPLSEGALPLWTLPTDREMLRAGDGPAPFRTAIYSSGCWPADGGNRSGFFSHPPALTAVFLRDTLNLPAEWATPPPHNDLFISLLVRRRGERVKALFPPTRPKFLAVSFWVEPPDPRQMELRPLCTPPQKHRRGEVSCDLSVHVSLTTSRGGRTCRR